MIVGYVRVSSSGQNPERQYADLEQAGAERIYKDELSGKNTERPQYLDMMGFLREGDTLVVHSLDRLSRNLSDLLSTLDQLTKRGVVVQFLHERLVFDPKAESSTDRLMLHMIGAFAEFERSMIRSRQREGIELAKLRGVYKGRQRTVTDEQIEAVKKDIALGVPLAKAARKQGLSRSTVYRYIK